MAPPSGESERDRRHLASVSEVGIVLKQIIFKDNNWKRTSKSRSGPGHPQTPLRPPIDNIKMESYSSLVVELAGSQRWQRRAESEVSATMGNHGPSEVTTMKYKHSSYSAIFVISLFT